MGSAVKALELLTGMKLMSVDDAKAAGLPHYHINSPMMHSYLLPYQDKAVEEDEHTVPSKEPTNKNTLPLHVETESGKVAKFWVGGNMSSMRFNKFLKNEGLMKDDSNAVYSINSLVVKNGNRPLKLFPQDQQSVQPFCLIKVDSDGDDTKNDPRNEKEAVITKDSLDPKWDYDFTNLRESSGEKYVRGDMPYYRPYTWNRYALTALGKYGISNTWLGEPGDRQENSPGEWIVTYHGTNSIFATYIADDDAYKEASRAVYGPGIYTTNIPEEAEAYARRTTSEKNKDQAEYIYIIQNRLNPANVEIVDPPSINNPDNSRKKYGTRRHHALDWNNKPRYKDGKPVYYYVTIGSDNLRMYGILEKKYK